jgi:transcriptional regulator with XRE-family HTH domain
MKAYATILQRIGDALGEQRRDLGLSRREVSMFTGVSNATVARIERGDRVSAKTLLKVAGVLTMLELYSPPPVDDIEPLVLIEPPTWDDIDEEWAA